MGYYNVGCAISGIPIVRETKIRAFILAEHKQASDQADLMDPSSLYMPLTTGLAGTSGGYGHNSIENPDPSPAFNAGFEFYFPEYKGNIAQFFEDIRDKEILATMDDGTQYPASIALVREDVYEAIMKINYRRRGATTDTATDFAIDRDAIRNLLLDIQKNTEESEISPTSIGSYVLKKIRTSEDKNPAVEENPYILYFLSSFVYQASYLSQTLTPYQETLAQMLDGEVNDDAIDFTAEIIKHIHMDAVLAGLSKPWHPAMSMIGQSEPFALNEAFTKAMGKIIRHEIEAVPDREQELYL
jgi:hypothetical protein